jgi:hypothetical protein
MHHGLPSFIPRRPTALFTYGELHVERLRDVYARLSTGTSCLQCPQGTFTRCCRLSQFCYLWNMPLTTDESNLLALIDIALQDAYPGRTFEVTARPHFARWIEVVITEHWQERECTIIEPVNRESIASPRLRDLRDLLMDSLIRRLGQPGRVA